MKEKIREILWNFVAGEVTDSEAVQQVLDLFAVSERNLLESILENMDGVYPEYHREIVEDYLDDGC